MNPVSQALGARNFFGVAPHQPIIVAHRGGSLEAPENTLEAVHRAVRTGSDWQEVDVALTADEVPVILHDDTLLRTTGIAGEVARMTHEEVRRLDAGNPSWDEGVRTKLALLGMPVLPQFEGRFVGQWVPTLAQLLTIPQARLMLELKHTSRPKVMATKVVEAVARAGAQARVAIASFNQEVLDEVRRADPSLAQVGLAETMAEARAMLTRPLAVLGVHTELVGEAWAATSPHIALWAWTVYTDKMAHAALAQGAHGLITDIPAALMATLRSQGPARAQEVFRA